MGWLAPTERDCVHCYGSGRNRHNPAHACSRCRGAGKVVRWWEDVLSCVVMALLLGLAAAVAWLILGR